MTHNPRPPQTGTRQRARAPTRLELSYWDTKAHAAYVRPVQRLSPCPSKNLSRLLTISRQSVRIVGIPERRPAQFNLAAMYAKGHGVPQSYAEAVKWYRLAAEQGFAMARANLGLIYKNGQGVPQV